MRTDTPEDRLLRLIKGKYKKKSDGEQTPATAKNPVTNEIIKSVFLKNKLFKPSYIKIFNRVLIAVLIIAAIYFLDSFLYSPYKNIDSLVPSEGAGISGRPTAVSEKVSEGASGDFSAYSKEIKGKNLFSAPFLSDTEESEVPEIDISKRFNLVGIIAGEEPQAIIEDKDAQKTHYLYKGQSFSGVDVVEIGTGKVILNYKGKQIILVL